MITNTQPLEVETQSVTVNRFKFDGSGREMFLLMLYNFILIIFTLGIYRFWATTRTRKYIWSHLTFAEDRLEYTGTGRELFTSFLKVGGIFFLWAVLSRGIGYFIPIMKGPIGILTAVIVFLLIGYAQYSGRNYRLARTRWRGIRLGMTNARREYMKTYVIYTLLMPLTFGLIAPVRWVKLRSILINNTRIGTKQLIYTGEAKEFYWRYMRGILFTFLTLGIYWFWHQARLLRYDYGNTHLGETKFKCVIQGGDLLYATFIGMLIVILTAGIGTPWALRLWLQIRTDTLAVMGTLPLEQIAQGGAESSAIGEEVADFLDVDLGF
jgi:uncharacterized membrane protein YjgN (DUF898 family)